VSADSPLTDAEWRILDDLLMKTYYEDDVGLYAWGDKGEEALADAQASAPLTPVEFLFAACNLLRCH
jgi:hypothetical protein